MTCRLNISFVRLPDDPMPRRLFDPRVGYFTDRFTHFGASRIARHLLK